MRLADLGVSESLNITVEEIVKVVNQLAEDGLIDANALPTQEYIDILEELVKQHSSETMTKVEFLFFNMIAVSKMTKSNDFKFILIA